MFVDPVDHKTCDMYQTTEIDCQVVAEAATQKRMFLAGELMMLALSSEDFDQYRYSEFAHSYPGSGSYFLALNGYEEVIKEREASPDFDRSTKDLETQLLKSFLKLIFTKCKETVPAKILVYSLLLSCSHCFILVHY